MMKEILITSSALILALLVIRQVFKGVLSRRVQYALWALVLVRLLVPVNFLPAADFSILTAAQPMEQAVSARLDRITVTPVRPENIQNPESPSGLPPVLDHVEPEAPLPQTVEPGTAPSLKPAPGMSAGEVMALAWKVGMALMGGFFLLSNLAFWRKLRRSRQAFAAEATRPVYLVPEGAVPSPCLFGRSIYITPAVASDPGKLRHVLAHESTHAKHLDPLWALLRCACLTVYWFDPLVWVAAACSKADCELACDESVLNTLGEKERIPYGQTLLSLIPVKRAGNPMVAATTMTAGKKQLKDRVSRIAKRPRQLAAAALAVAVLAGAISACTFTGAKESPAPSPSQGPTESTLRSLTGEELRWFNEEFFNHFNSPISYTYNVRNQFINAAFNLYDKPEDIDLYELFYVDGSVLSDAEYYAVFGVEEMNCPAFKLTAEEMDEILKEYTGLTLEQTNKVGLENLTYQEGAYYWMHGDTNYPGNIEIVCGTWEGGTVKLYHHGWSSGSEWYCTTLEAQPGGGYWFKSNRESEAPAIPTPLPAWDPETTIDLSALEPYVAPTVTVTDYPNHYSFNYKTSYANWNIDDHHIVVYKAADGVVYAAYEENDVYHVFQSGLSENSDCVFFYNGLLGHDGFTLDYYGLYEGSDNFRPLRDYYFFDGSGVLTLLARCETGYDGREPSILDLNGDGKHELVCSRQLFFERDGAVYEARLDELVNSACPELTDTWDFIVDKYGKCLRVYGHTEDYKDAVRYLYFDGENLLVYKNEKPTEDHMVVGADTGVPQAVAEAARDYVQRVYTASQTPTAPEPQGEEYAWGDPASWDDWRVDYFTGPYTYSHGGITVEGWQFNYEMHTTTPEEIVLAGGKYITEDDWVSPGYPGCDALFFEVKDGEYRLLDRRMVQEGMYSYYIEGVVLQLMEDRGVELSDGSTYAQLWFRKYLGHLTDLTETLRIQYDDGQGKGGAYLVNPQEDNGAYYLGQMRDNYAVWSRTQAPAAEPAGPSVTLSGEDWYETLRFWRDSGLVMYKNQNREPEWYEVRYDGDSAQDVFAYRALPYYWARCWFDEAEYGALEAALPPIPDEGQSYLNIAQEWTEAHEGLMTQLSPGSSMSCAYVKVTGVGTLEDMPETWFPWEIVDYPHFAFTYDVAFVPENQDALSTLMAGNTGEYEGGDPDVPGGAFAYSRRGSMYLMDGNWYCGGVGTG